MGVLGETALFSLHGGSLKCAAAVGMCDVGMCDVGMSDVGMSFDPYQKKKKKAVGLAGQVPCWGTVTWKERISDSEWLVT